MPVIINIELLCGRYHATPWGSASNEGVTEWPPSPWRLARAFASAWHGQPIDQRAPAERLDELLRALAEPPMFVLPRVTAGESRHYMPLADDKRDSGKRETTIVLDPFLRTNGGLRVVWENVDLDSAARELLEQLCSSIGYLGRSESLCEMTCSWDLPQPIDDGRFRCGPLGVDGEVHGKPVRTLVVAPDVSLEHLSQSTAARRKKHLTSPPGGTFTTYDLDPAGLRAMVRRRRPAPEPRFEVLRFSLDGVALPPLTQAIRLASLLRGAALARADDAAPESVAILRGADAEGTPLRGHQHCHYLASDEDGDGRIDHLTVWCPRGLTRTEIGFVDVTSLGSWWLDDPLQLTLLNSGSRETIPAPLVGQARRWSSHTPFVPARHAKRRAGRIVEGYDEQVARELAWRGLPAPREVRFTPGSRRQWSEFRTERSTKAARRGPVLGIELEFDQPVAGPIALGRHSHFGMGLFLPCD